MKMLRSNANNPAMFALTILIGILLTLAAGDVRAAGSDNPAGDTVQRAIAVLHPTAGSHVSGTVTFTGHDNGVQVSATVDGLKAGKHGFHIHELGDCSAPDGTSAGGHYNPEGNPHAGPDQMKRHVGDLGNLEADQSGHSRYERRDAHLSLNGPQAIVGRAVIVHAGEDDLSSQPTGAAGARMACGVIGIAAP